VEAEEEYASWKAGFDIEKKTDDVARDLDKYDELRRSVIRERGCCMPESRR